MVLLNHSCATNTTRFYHGKRTILVAKRLIRSGEEISNNYGCHHLQLPKGKRLARLKDDYKFTCGCDACCQDYPTLKGVNGDFGKQNKSLKKQLEKILMAYQASFQAGALKKALEFSEEYLRHLSSAKIRYPHKNYEIGAIAMNSCWWAIIAQDHAARLD